MKQVESLRQEAAVLYSPKDAMSAINQRGMEALRQENRQELKVPKVTTIQERSKIEQSLGPLRKFLAFETPRAVVDGRVIPATAVPIERKAALLGMLQEGASVLDAAANSGVDVVADDAGRLARTFLVDGKYVEQPEATEAAPEPMPLTPPPTNAIPASVQGAFSKAMEKKATQADKDANGIDDQDEVAMAWAKENQSTNPIKAKAIMDHIKAKYPKVFPVKQADGGK
jgi:hypothetical protein